MKLKYFIDDKGKKIYTINANRKNTKDAHYKFIKIRNAPNKGIRNLMKTKSPTSSVPSKL